MSNLPFHWTVIKIIWSEYSGPRMVRVNAWWWHQIEIFSALLAFCAGNSPVNGEFPAQRPVMRSFDVIFDLCLNKWLSKQSWGWWSETLSLWRHCNGVDCSNCVCCSGVIHNRTSNGSWCMCIKGEMSGTVCVTFTWYMYIYELFIAFVCFVVCSLL